MPPNNLPGISVVICCYNSAMRLPRVIQHLAKQQVGGMLQWEVIIVNNNSADNTKDIAASLLQQYPQLNGRLVDEPQAGLTYARITGAKAAKHHYLLFCDDDNLLCPEYLNTAWIIMQSDDRIGVLSGHGTGTAEHGAVLPKWFSQEQSIYANGEQHPERNHHVYGAGMVVPRALFLSIYTTGYPFISEDRKGASLSSGGDTEMCYIVTLLGYQLRYDNRLQFEHIMPASRLNKEYLGRLKSGIGHSFIQLLPYRYLIDGKEADGVAWIKDMVIFSTRTARQWLFISSSERKGKAGMLQSYWQLRGKYKVMEQKIREGIEGMRVAMH